MAYIIGKNREDIIKKLKETGDLVLVAKTELIYSLPHGVNGLKKDELLVDVKKRPETYEYYRAGLIKITEIKEA